MKFHGVLVAGALIGAAGLCGCHATSRAFGLSKVTPDEFRVVTKAPLVLPPDYSLRPPAPGEPRPQELQPEEAARAALDQRRGADQRSDGEKLLISRAGGDHADPLIAYEVDDEFGGIAHKDKGFADWVMFWRRDKPAAPPAGHLPDQASTPIDPGSEENRLKQLTGGGTVVIAREGGSKVKLPGL
ncbi:MAG: DUF3035 domain-containing protein [Caulobacteraceae bacterium]|nr:DUF3035 domain-containing protein [Caulobacteraceae bacterium]